MPSTLTARVGASPSLRARRKRATRTALAEAAMALFVARGFDAVPVEDIATAAGVSRRTFFRYFPSKEAAFFVGQQGRLAAFEAALRSCHRPGEPTAAVRSGCADIALVYERDRVAVLREHAVRTASTTLTALDAQLDAHWEDALRAALRRGGATELDTIVAAGALLGTMRGVLRAWFDCGGGFDLHARGEQALCCLDPLLHAVCDRAQVQGHAAWTHAHNQESA